MNLVSNSLKYSHTGCVVNISIREILHLHKPSFMIEVSDTGIGMDKNFLAKLFAPYAREFRLNSVQGTGLGMSIVKNVVTIMGGDIKVKSAVDVGTTFTINIPFRLADEETTKRIESSLTQNNLYSEPNQEQQLPCTNTPQEVEPEAVNVESSKLSLAVMENFSLKDLNILIVEDNQLNMEIACDILGMKGVKLTSAWDGVQAVEVFNKEPEFTFDAILMDMRMPNMDGCEASSQIRASNKADAKTIPIIACTANAFTEDIAATQSAGMNAHVSKPLDFTVLEHVLSKVIASRTDLEHLVRIHPQIIHNQDVDTLNVSKSSSQDEASVTKANNDVTAQAEDRAQDKTSTQKVVADDVTSQSQDELNITRAIAHNSADISRLSNDAKPPVIPKSSKLEGTLKQGDFISEYHAQKDNQAAVEPKVIKPSFGSLDVSKMKVKSTDAQQNLDYSHLEDNGTYTLFKRKNKNKIDAHSLLNDKK